MKFIACERFRHLRRHGSRVSPEKVITPDHTYFCVLADWIARVGQRVVLIIVQTFNTTINQALGAVKSIAL